MKNGRESKLNDKSHDKSPTGSILLNIHFLTRASNRYLEKRQEEESIKSFPVFLEGTLADSRDVWFRNFLL